MSYISTFLKEYAYSVVEIATNIIIDSLSSKAKQQILKNGPRDPFLSRRLFKKWRDKIKLSHPTIEIKDRLGELPPKNLAGVRAKRIIVAHDADRVGFHVEAYLSIDGIAYNIGVKRISPEVLVDLGIRRNRNGWLTRSSQEKLMRFWADEFALKETRWLAQSTTHTESEAKHSWPKRQQSGISDEGYGAGELRQVLDEIDVAVSTTGNSVEFVDPLVDKHRKCFVFKIMDKKPDKRPKNILGVGRKENPDPPKVEKLKLKFDQDPEKFKRIVGKDGIYTLKEDGASVKFRITKKGSQFWSPRISKVTGAHIMYDSKLRDWIAVTSDVSIEGMGEFLAYRKLPIFLSPNVFSSWFLKLWPHSEQYCSAAEIGGLLNSNYPIPEDVKLQLKIYLISKEGRIETASEPYQTNYKRILEVSKLHIDWDPVVMFNNPTISELSKLSKNCEGFVGIPLDKSLGLAGRKMKLRPDSIDGIITKVDFTPGPKGKVAGVVWYKDDKTNQEYKTASGITEELKKEMMLNPKEYEGKVMVLSGFNGGNHRAVKVKHIHPDKGVA